MQSFLNATFLTTTTYGTWLPGDVRGYVEQGEVLPGSPGLRRFADRQLKSPPVVLSSDDRLRAFDGLLAGCEEFAYRLGDAAIEPTHLHAILCHDDPVKTMVGRLKNRMRQAVGRGQIWTKGYCARTMSTLEELQSAREYIAKHTGACWIDGERVSAPGSAGGSV